MTYWLALCSGAEGEKEIDLLHPEQPSSLLRATDDATPRQKSSGFGQSASNRCNRRREEEVVGMKKQTLKILLTNKRTVGWMNGRKDDVDNGDRR